MPNPAIALKRWINLLAPSGRLILIEGFWSNGVGLTAEQTMKLVEDAGGNEPKSPDHLFKI